MKIASYVTVLFFAFMVSSAVAGDKELYLYSWSNYIPVKVINEFSKETGITVNYSTYDSNEEMFEALMMTGGNGYDLVVPSGYYVGKMKNSNLLSKIDITKLANYSNLNMKLCGKHSEYGVPYFWGSTLLLVNSTLVNPEEITSWNDLFKPVFKDNIIFPDDLRDAFSIALYSLGYSINTKNRDQIKEAHEWLKNLIPGVKFVDSGALGDQVVEDNIAAAVVYNGDALFIQKSNPEYVAIYPKEGVPLWIDYFVIPKGAKNVESAYAFLDYMLQANVNKAILEELFYSTPNQVAFDSLDAELKNNIVLNPTEKELGESEYTDSVGKSLGIYERYWQMLMSH